MVQSQALMTGENHHASHVSIGALREHLPCERFRLELKILSLTVLPPYKGGTFRGAFGNAFMRTVCAMRETECDACILKDKCLYASLFQPGAPKDFTDAAKYGNAPPPYVLNPPLDNRQAFMPGDSLEFDLILMGRAIDALPYFIYCFMDMGKRGIGKERGRYELTNVELIRRDGVVSIYDGDTQTLKGFDKGPEPAQDDNQDVRDITIRFLTPLRLKEKNSLVTKLAFPLFFDRLIHRLKLLSIFYGTNGPIPMPNTLLKQAETIKTKEDRLHWYDWSRYSSRQKELMKLGGLKGEIAFEGDLTPFMPYLRLAETINVGQGTSFGLGRIEVKTHPEV